MIMKILVSSLVLVHLTNIILCSASNDNQDVEDEDEAVKVDDAIIKPNVQESSSKGRQP